MSMEEARAWVAKLNGMNILELRDLMRAHNVTGVPYSPRTCIIAKFIQQETRVATTVGVRELMITSPQRLSERFTMGDGLKDFTLMFDLGLIPSLVDGVNT